ncbi:hypothetical protein GCM10022289_31200 [Pedobacter jeongneungensis]|uniref:PoNi C-terminal domain-containing protein n=1 Tax=Pedobacter jeongneungensis TaxID=947309 RepID=A0ABP8BIU6_9SPHI
MFRDKFKSEEYFKKTTARILNNLEAKKNNGLNDKPLSNIENYVLANGLYIYVFRAYSLGDPVKNLIDPCKEMLIYNIDSIHLNEDYSDGGDIAYTELLGMVAMGVLLDAKEELYKLSLTLEKVNYRDYLIDFLLKFSRPDLVLTDKMMWPDDVACKQLRTIIQANKIDAEKEMKAYLEKYYYTKANFEDEYNSHKRTDTTYKGYWSFESAAIVKIMGLSDDGFKYSPYYPYDMLHDEPLQPSFSPVMPLLPDEDEHKSEVSPNPPPKKKWWQF